MCMCLVRVFGSSVCVGVKCVCVDKVLVWGKCVEGPTVVDPCVCVGQVCV